MRNSIEYFTDVKSLTKFDKVISYSTEYITCENSTEFLTLIFYQNVSHVRNSTVYVACEEFDPILYSCETMEK